MSSNGGVEPVTASIRAPGRSARGYALVSVATLLWSFAGLYVRAAGQDAWTTLAGRCLVGGTMLVADFALVHRRDLRGAARGLSGGGGPWLPLVAAAAIGAYVGGLVLTELARFMIVYATLPFVSGAFAWGLYGERPTGRAMSAALVALVGIAVMMAGPGGGAHWLGDALSAVSTIGFAGLLVAARHRAGTPMSLVNGLGALLCVPLGLAFARPVGLGAWQAGMIAWFGASTLYLAFRLYMTGVRDVPAAEASVVSAADSALGPLWVFLVFGETPSRATLEGGAIVMAAVLWQLIGGLADARRGAATAEP